MTDASKAQLRRRARLLAGASVTYNVVEAVIAVTAGLVAGSVALVGFGLDSVVEVSSGLIILWQFRHALPESRERQALRMMAISFFALAAYVGFESVRSLVAGHDPDASPVGIALAAVSLAVMPFLSWAQRRTGRALGSNAVVADSTQTLLCTYLSAVLLVGLLANATLGWSWADPVAGLVIAGIALKEGRQAWRGEGCCAPAPRDAAAGSCADGCCTTDARDADLPLLGITPTPSPSRPSMNELLTTDACTMPTSDRPLRLAEFDTLFESVTAVHHNGTVTRLHLDGTPGLADRVRDLTDRESQCCSFFTFTVTGSDTEVDLEITAPPRHQPIVAAIAARAAEVAR